MALNWASLPVLKNRTAEKCRARSDCTYVHFDLALHSPQERSVVALNVSRSLVNFAHELAREIGHDRMFVQFPPIFRT